MRWVILLLLSGCLEPRVCRVDTECPYATRCEIVFGQDAGVCRQEGDAGVP